MLPVQHNNSVKCTVEVSKDFFGFYQEFRLFSDDGIFMACAKKISMRLESY